MALVLAPTPAWWLDLPAQLAAHAGVAVLLVGAMLSVLRPRPGLEVALLGAAAVLAGWATPGRAPVKAPDGADTLRIVTYNMAGQTSLMDAGFFDWLDATEADLVCLIHPPWPLPSRRDEIEERFPYRVEPRPGMSWAVVLLSRYPAEVRRVDLRGDLERFSFAANRTLRVTLPSGSEMLFSGAYHTSPRTASHWARGVREAARDGAALRVHIEETGLPCVAAGDFNTTPLGRAFAKFRDASGMRSAQRLLGSGTWPASWPPWLAAPIDHVWLSDGVQLTGVRVGPRFRSDHRPLVADVALDAAPASDR